VLSASETVDQRAEKPKRFFRLFLWERDGRGARPYIPILPNINIIVIVIIIIIIGFFWFSKKPYGFSKSERFFCLVRGHIFLPF